MALTTQVGKTPSASQSAALHDQAPITLGHFSVSLGNGAGWVGQERERVAWANGGLLLSAELASEGRSWTARSKDEAKGKPRTF